MKALPLIGARCHACGGWVSRRCPCGGNPCASIEQHARWATAVDRATTKHDAPNRFEAPRRRSA
jgi:hypothetical protein